MRVIFYNKMGQSGRKGGIAYGKLIMKQLEEQVKFIAPVKIYPGEDEMAALASNALAVLEGREAVKTY